MSTAHSPDNFPPLTPLINGVYDVAGYHIGKSLVDVFQKSFTSGGKIRHGDYYVGRSRPLIQQFYARLPNGDQNAIQDEFQSAMAARERMESARGFKKFLRAKKYEEVARYLFVVTKTASRRVADQNIMVQISEAVAGRPLSDDLTQSTTDESTEPAFGTVSTMSDPFSDSHATTSLADVDVGNLSHIEMTVFESATDG